MQFLIDHCGNLSVDDFTRYVLKHLQEKLEQEGVTGRPFARPLVNRYVSFIKTAFREAEESGLCSESIVDSLARVRPLKRGKTTAREYEPVDHVDTDVVKATLPFMSEIIRAMVMIHLLCSMRSQDVINLRICDIEMNDPKYPGVWWYAPHDHKTKKQGKKLVKVIPPEAQEILRPFIEAKKDTPEAFLFSPKDAIKKHRKELRENRQSKPTPSQIERAKRAQKRKPKHPLGERYTAGSYRTAVQRAQERAKKAGIDIPHWFPHQIRHESVSEIKARFGMKAARDMAGHSSSKVTKGYTHEKLDRMAMVARKQSRIFS
jgi:integrase